MQRKIIKGRFRYIIGILVFMIFLPKKEVDAAKLMFEKESIGIASYVPFISLLCLIGGSIIVTLFYVAWRKFRANKNKVKKHHSNH